MLAASLSAALSKSEVEIQEHSEGSPDYSDPSEAVELGGQDEIADEQVEHGDQGEPEKEEEGDTDAGISRLEEVEEEGDTDADVSLAQKLLSLINAQLVTYIRRLV